MTPVVFQTAYWESLFYSLLYLDVSLQFDPNLKKKKKYPKGICTQKAHHLSVGEEYEISGSAFSNTYIILFSVPQTT